MLWFWNAGASTDGLHKPLPNLQLKCCGVPGRFVIGKKPMPGESYGMVGFFDVQYLINKIKEPGKKKKKSLGSIFAHCSTSTSRRRSCLLSLQQVHLPPAARLTQSYVKLVIVGKKLYSSVVGGYFKLFECILGKLSRSIQEGSEAQRHLLSENGECSVDFSYSQPRRTARPVLLVWAPPGWHKDRNALPRGPFKLTGVIAYRGVGFTMGYRGKSSLWWGSDNFGDFMEGDLGNVCSVFWDD